MGKNMVICCDGTNNSMEGPLTNIVRIHELTKDVLQQVSIYDAGVGVQPKPGLRTWLGRKISKLSGSALGTGLVRNVEEMYGEIRKSYEPGDRLFLFGFSRGAYTVKVLAGLLEGYGLIRRGEEGSIHEVVMAYSRRAEGAGRDRLKERCERLAPHFLGLFDAVSSVGWAWNPTTFPWATTMPSVIHVRHALALDERRAKFRTNRVNPIHGQDVKEVWFAGVHSDVGGGYQPPGHQLGRVTLGWMLEEATKQGLLLNDSNAVPGLKATLAEDEQAPQHESLDKAWWALEWVPLPHHSQKNGKWVEGRRIYRGKGWRMVRPSDLVSSSVQRRRRPVKNEYWPSVRGSVTWV